MPAYSQHLASRRPHLCRGLAAGLLFTAALVAPRLAAAEVVLPHILSDHMVVQAGKPLVIWGKADPGERILIEIAGHKARVAAGADGRWRATLKPLTAGASPLTLKVKGSANTLEVKDVLVGETWLASGQSNMRMGLTETGKQPVFGAEDVYALPARPQIRLFKVARQKASAPAEDLEGRWEICDSQALKNSQFSAAAYFFGRRLQDELKTPVGLIDSTWGGTRIEVWTPPAAYAPFPALERFAKAAPGAKVDGSPLAGQYNAMIAPLTPYRLAGVIWYQGESNVTEPLAQADYADKMRALIGGWRSAFDQDLPFYYVQIAPHLYHVARSTQVASAQAAAELREAQEQVLDTPGTGMVITTDLVDDLFDIHPRNKRDIGERLANIALTRTYGRAGLGHGGPRFKSLTIEGDRAVLSFEDLGGGLKSSDGKPLSWFALAGADGVFHAGQAVIEADKVIVTSSQVSAPVQVRFGWDEAARPNLVSQQGLPAWPFRTARP
ncbi:sialate O-acetylesterase [Caulobacter endophyticus]|uniref:sialate O-acetylesterase n=1 Tax=Caulobacter endophyticus TaxID=2172652 RepID=UPI00240F6A34|nr:sialate O-acetylesterase [Caulobacter endophyticus]MDG2528151.1 sialate O-acetylesterase [Caulobacter endophyticus]